MIHFGDITQISGYAVPPVDVVTGGSPCQDYADNNYAYYRMFYNFNMKYFA